MSKTYESLISPLMSDDSRVAVGRFTYGNPALKLWTESESINIGAFCSIAEDVVIFGGGEHRSDWVTTFPLRIAFGDAMAWRDGHPVNKGPTRIGNDVWLGYGAIVLSGVTIGDGAIVGAGTVVARDVPPYSIVAGNPARIIKMRFSDNHIEKLLKISWWNWPIEKIYENQHSLCSDNIANFIAEFG